ncbi:MAG: hypothetical protein DRP02_00525 [Candidatus Gerdarchaeota archaeon]|nr:MAG: hypothetical protein DRP02_00525 [Candidatus Gerdarchaeota archaeon]
MRIVTKKTIAITMLFIVTVSMVPSYVLGWQSDQSTLDNRLFTRPRFSTTQWLSWEAVKIFPDAKISWITENLYAFWHGVEAPYNGNASVPYGYSYTDYGDIDKLKIGLDAAGTTVVYANLSIRAQEEYTKLVAELSKEDTDYKLAAFYAGTMSHYVGQAGTWYAIWNATAWGFHYGNNETLFTEKVVAFENAIEAGVSKSYFDEPAFNYRYTDMSVYYNNYFNVTPNVVAAQNAYNASITLAQQIYPYAENLLVDLNDSVTKASNWEATYKDRVLLCLNYTVEAIYSALEHAMEAVNWSYLDLPVPQFTYDNYTNYITIPEFEVRFRNSSGEYILDDKLATMAQAWYIVRDDDSNEPVELSMHYFDLAFNVTTQKWYYNSLAYNAVAQKNQSIIYRFDMDRAAPTWSNVSANAFYVYYYNTTVEGLTYIYHSKERTIDVFNITVYCHDIPEIGEVLPDEVDTAIWILYQKGHGATQTGEVIGVPKKDTEGNVVTGELQWDPVTRRWYDNGSDIGLVFTPTGVDLYIIARFNLTIPVGYYQTSTVGGGEPIFYPYVQQKGTKYFVTRDHNITITKPIITYDPENNIVNITNIRAWSDYNHTFLDYYEIIEKPVDPDIVDIREARWKIFLFDGIPSALTGHLQWDNVSEFWYAANIDVSSLPDNTYYVSAKIVNLNANFTTSPWGPASELFTVERPLPVIYYILPEFFLAGFVALFLWVAWIRVKKKKKRIEEEREAHIEEIYRG